MTINGTAGNDDLVGTSGNDLFELCQGGNDTADGLGGNDVFNFESAFNAADTIDGGDGTDTVRLKGNYSVGVTLGVSTLASVERIQLAAGFSYKLTTNDANVAAAATLRIDAGALGVGDALTFNGSAETNGHFIIIGGAGNDTLNLGNDHNFVDLTHGGNDHVTGGSKQDVYLAETTLVGSDSINGVDGHDVLRFTGTGAATLQNIINLGVVEFTPGFSYNINAQTLFNPSRSAIIVDEHTLGAADSLVYNGSGGNTPFYFVDGAGNDTLIGSNGNNHFRFSGRGNDNATGGSGADAFYLTAAPTGSIHIDGGAGNDVVFLQGGAADLSPNVSFVNVEAIRLDATGDSTVTVPAAFLTVGNTLDVKVSGDATFTAAGATGTVDLLLTGNAGTLADITGGSASDTIRIRSGNADIDGGPGADHIVVNAHYQQALTIAQASDSTDTGYDTVQNFNPDIDSIGNYGNGNIPFTFGGVMLATLGQTLEAALGAAQLPAHGCCGFVTNGIDGYFVVLDMNGIAGYQAGQDSIVLIM